MANAERSSPRLKLRRQFGWQKPFAVFGDVAHLTVAELELIKD
jgi:hypothetical protein